MRTISDDEVWVAYQAWSDVYDGIGSELNAMRAALEAFHVELNKHECETEREPE